MLFRRKMRCVDDVWQTVGEGKPVCVVEILSLLLVVLPFRTTPDLAEIPSQAQICVISLVRF